MWFFPPLIVSTISIMSHPLLFLLLLSTVLANDAAAMLKLANSIRPLPSTWTNTSSEGYCNWNGVQCHSGRVTSIRLAGQNLTGTLPEEMVSLTELQTLSLSHNRFDGDLPLLARLPNLRTLDLDNNNFTSIPSDFFLGFTSLLYMSLDFNNFSPWELPVDLSKCTNLAILTASGSNIVGSIPDIFNSIENLQHLGLSFNNLTGPLPPSMANSRLQYLLLANQGVGLTGRIDVLASMTWLSLVRLDGNHLTGPIPDLSNCTSIVNLQLQDNRLTGIVPTSLVTLPNLKNVSLSNNKLQGPIPLFPSAVTNVADGINNYCAGAGVPCDPQVTILLEIAGAFGYPELLSDRWVGNYVCNWSFVNCDTQKKNIVSLDFTGQHFEGTISPAIANLTFLQTLLLKDNNLTGPIPNSLTELTQLVILDVSNNNLSGNAPRFSPSVKVQVRPGNDMLKTSNGIGNGEPPDKNATARSGNPPGIEIPTGSSKMHWQTLVIAAVMVAVIITVSIPVVWYIRRNWRKNAKHNKRNETFTKRYHSHAPNQYSYSDIKKMTNSFINVLGEGGFGTVYKGELPDGRPVAVKVLNKSIGDGEEFMNEVASISRTSHVNIVTLFGFCHEKTKRALIYEYMPNGSLDRFIYGQACPQSTNHYLEWKTLYEIAIGIARGLEYLHRDCNTRIVHFDIKPHNILLDEDFCPKISDFGLAKLCKRKESKVSMLGTRGTAGYIAPEIFCRNIGGVSYKSDVYSYGMMVLEIVERRKNSLDGESNTGEIYFPDWIYKHLESGEISKVYDAITDEEEEIVAKMLLVGLWSIQTKPSDRPSMTKVLEMLEGGLQSLHIPPKPSSLPSLYIQPKPSLYSSTILSQEHSSIVSSPRDGLSRRDEGKCTER